jgi:hypothetical protein
MRALGRESFLAAGVAIALAIPLGSAFAGVPDVHTSSAPRGILLVGLNGSPDPIGAATYVLRNIAGFPWPGSQVTLNFSSCGDVAIDAGSTPHIDCAAHTVSGLTDVNGVVTFRIVGTGLGGASRPLPTCVSVNVDGIPFPSLSVGSFDLDGRNGVNALDLGVFGMALFSSAYAPRCDYDFDGDVDAVDLGLLGQAMTSGGSVESGTPCP